MNKVPRESRKKQEVDVSRFKPLVEEALKAFGTHPTYAEQMSRQAVTIVRKRAVWSARTRVNKAMKSSKAECEKLNFVCEVENPCGTGACPFASTELADLNIVAPGKCARPKNSNQGPYDPDEVVRYLHAQRPSALARPQEEDEEG